MKFKNDKVNDRFKMVAEDKKENLGDKMGSILKVIADNRKGTSFHSHRYCHDTEERGAISYDEHKDVIWKNYGESDKLKRPVYLKAEADARAAYPSIFTFFLDGSRHTYKVDDMSFHKNVYPIIAGQVGVGVCMRKDRELHPAIPFERKLVVSLPDKAFSTDCDEIGPSKVLIDKINKNIGRMGGTQIYFDDLLIYNTNKDEKFDKKGIATIQDYMVELEKQIVAKLVSKLNSSSYLIKDGSLDYRYIPQKSNKKTLNLSEEHIRKNYRYVVGVSKSFDPTKCFVEGGGTNSNVIANLKPYERTPAYRYESKIAKVDFCVWYLRIREARQTKSVFDGVLKVEKLICTDEEFIKGIDTDEINNITTYLINERNPVCYGADERWANHLYPIYLTEQYIKSKYLSHELFIQLF